jgi:hypothetical protein
MELTQLLTIALVAAIAFAITSITIWKRNREQDQ